MTANDDRVAVVTGANRGLGAEIARQVEEHGVRVVRTSREPREGFETLDVTRPEQAAALVGRLPSGGLDILVNNAGLSLDGFDADVARRTLETNLFGAMHVTDALLPAMRAGGRIVMVSSGMGDVSGVRTRMGGRSAPRSVEEGARTAVWLALLPDGGPTGGFFKDERPIPW